MTSGHELKISKLKYLQYKQQAIARMTGIGRDWMKKGKPGISNHLVRVWKAELDVEKKHVWSLESQVIALAFACDAKDAEIAAQEARIARLTRLLRARSRRPTEAGPGDVL